MRVFLSWSGERSHQLAQALRDWLPMIVQRLSPYISSEIEKGTRWSSDIARELEQCSYGISCVTAENKEAPWLLFEAGALSKSISDGRVAPILFCVDHADIQKNPLSQFQLTRFDQGELKNLVVDINGYLGEGKVEERVVDQLFEALWPRLEAQVNSIIRSAGAVASRPARQEEDYGKILGAIDELMATTRSMSQVMSDPVKLLPREYLEHILRRSHSRLNSIDERDHDEVRFLIRKTHEKLHTLMSTEDPSVKSELISNVHRSIIQIDEILNGRRRSMRRFSPPREARSIDPSEVVEGASGDGVVRE